jgi:hypothetical protein
MCHSTAQKDLCATGRHKMCHSTAHKRLLDLCATRRHKMCHRTAQNMYTRGALQALSGKNGREKHGSTSAQTIGNLKMTLAMLQVLKLHVRLCTPLPCCISRFSNCMQAFCSHCNAVTYCMYEFVLLPCCSGRISNCLIE